MRLSLPFPPPPVTATLTSILCISPLCSAVQPCLWCYHQVLEEATKENLPARCPNCRAEYDQNKISMQHIDAEKLEEEKRKLKEAQRPKGASGSGSRLPRAALTNIRVVQPNLVYAVGLPMDICHEDVLRENEFFGQFGKTVKISVNRSNQYASAMAKHGPTGSAYVTFKRAEDALRCIKAIDGAPWRGKPVKACFGTTKYCNAFLKGLVCNNPDCLYLHELADEADCLTKEEVAAGLLPARFLAMGATNTFKPRLTINLIPNAATQAAQAAAAAAAAAGQPASAITAAAAAAGGISRAASGQQAAPGVTPPRVLTISMADMRSQSGGVPAQRQESGTGGALVSPRQGPGGPAAATAAAVPAGLGPYPSTAAPAPAPRGLWATAAAGGTASSAPVGNPPPPSDNQEWPTLASTPRNNAGGGGSQVKEDSAEALSLGATEGLHRAPSMAEQLAKAHSNPAEAKAARQAKKLLPLTSPGKLKPLGKAVHRPASPLDVHGLRSSLDEAEQADTNGNGTAAGHPAAPRQEAEGKTFSNPQTDPAIARPPARGPPPGFAAAPGAGVIGQPAQQHGAPSYTPLDSLRLKKVVPPPGFGGGLSPSSYSQHSSVDSSSQLASAPAGPMAPSQGPPGFGHPTQPAGQQPFSALIGSGPAPLFDAAPLGSVDSAPPVAAPSRRQKSRFAFAQEEEDRKAELAANRGAHYPESSGATLHSNLVHQPMQQHAAHASPQDAGAFFKSLFPGANVNVAGPQQQQYQQQYHPRPAAPPGFGAGEAASGPAHAGYAPPLRADPVSGGQSIGGDGLPPGLMLLRQLQGGGAGGPPGFGGAQQARAGAPPGYTAPSAPPGFGMQM